MQRIIRRKNRSVVDGKNWFIIRDRGEHSVANGRFAIDRNNRLAFCLNEPASWRRQYGLEDKIIFMVQESMLLRSTGKTLSYHHLRKSLSRCLILVPLAGSRLQSKSLGGKSYCRRRFS